jgi:hypothetical protein
MLAFGGGFLFSRAMLRAVQGKPFYVAGKPKPNARNLYLFWAMSGALIMWNAMSLFDQVHRGCRFP